MGIRVAVGLLVIAVLVLLLRGSLFGGDESKPSAARPGSIPTATPPADLPGPVTLGEAQAATGSPAAGGSGSTYVVKSGDTLGAIAAQLGIPADQQAAWIAEVLRLNGIEDARLLQAGVELKLPARAQSATATPTRASGTPTATSAAGTRTPTPTPRPTTTGGAGTYTVVSGDYPTLIGEKHCVPEAELDAWAQELLDLNGVQATNLQVGQVLELPAGTPPLCVREEEPTPTPTPTSVP